MAEQQNEYGLPIGKGEKRRTARLLPRFYRTESNKKFIQAESFIEYDKDEFSITTQGKELIKKLIDNTNNTNNKRHIGILRLSWNIKINDKQVSKLEKMKENC